MLRIAEFLGLPAWALVLIALGVGAVAGAWGMAQVMNGRLAAQQVVQEKAKLEAFRRGAAVQEGVDKAVIRVGGKAALAQQKVVTRTIKIREEIPIYVKDSSTCITVGLVRVFDAAVHGVDPAALDLAPGESNDTCAEIGADTLADAIVANFGIAHENAAQLDGLNDAVAAIIAQLEVARRQAPTP